MTLTTSDPDAEATAAAIRAVRRGDRDAFGEVVERYQRRLFGLLVMMTRDPAAAEDVAQDAFVRAFLHLDAYDTHRPFYPWLSTIAVRLAQNWLVKRNRTRVREGVPVDEDMDAATEADPLVQVIGDERGRHLWNAVASLPSGERTAALLHYRQDMGVREISSALGVSDGTIKTLLFRARRRLRLLLDERGSERSAS